MSDATIDPVVEAVKEEVVQEDEEDDQIVTPWKVTTRGQFNYHKLQTQFGLKPITSDLVTALEEVSGQPASHFLTREIFFAHQDFDKVLEDKKQGKEVFLYWPWPQW